MTFCTEPLVGSFTPAAADGGRADGSRGERVRSLSLASSTWTGPRMTLRCRSCRRHSAEIHWGAMSSVALEGRADGLQRLAHRIRLSRITPAVTDARHG